MILNAIIQIVVSMLQPIFNALPKWSLSSAVNLPSLGSTLATPMSIANQVFPLVEVVTMLGLVYGVLMPAFMVYRIANWGWRHFPDLWGFGPAAG